MPEFQDEVVVAHYPVGLQAAVHLGEVDGALALMDLHGIPAAQRDVRTPFADEMNEVPLPAGAAAGAGLRGGDFGVLVRPDIERQQSPPYWHRLRLLRLLLGGAALQRCDRRSLLNMGFTVC